MSIESSFRDLYTRALELVEERDRQILYMLEMCAVALLGRTVDHKAIRQSYKAARDAVADLVQMEERLVRLQMPKDRSMEWHMHHQALISSLQVQRYGYLIKPCRRVLFARFVVPAERPNFSVLFEEGLKCAEESYVQQLLLLGECNMTRNFESIEYSYRESEKAVNRISSIVNSLRLQHIPTEEDFVWHHFQRWLITALDSYRYEHVMELWRQALMRKQRRSLEPLPEEL
jgi:hypothetical protein